MREGKKATQGIYYYGDPEIEKWRYNPYRKRNRVYAEHWYNELKKGCPFPLHIIIEPTNRCNLNCIMCNHQVMTRSITDMDMDTYKKIVDEAVENYIYSISLYALGEPMLHPNIREMASYAKRMGVPYVDLSTNATIDMTPLLGTALNELIVSIDGDEKTFSEIRKGGNYAKVVNNLFNFLEKRKAGDYDWPLVRLQIIDFQPPKYDIEKLIEAWLDYPPKADATNLSHPPKVDVIYRKALEGMTQSIGNTILSKEEQEKRNKGRNPCKQLYYTLTINSNGDIAYCCHDPHGKSILGNVKDMTLKEAWQKVEKIRQEQMKGIYNEFCRECCDWNTW